MERDKYKVLVEHLKSKKVVSSKIAENNNAYRFTPTNTISNGDMFAQTKDHNNMLKVEVNEYVLKGNDKIKTYYFKTVYNSLLCHCFH